MIRVYDVGIAHGHAFVAMVNASCLMLGRHDEGLDCLEGCFGRGWGNRDWVINDSDYDPVRTHPRFQALFAKLGS